MPGQVYCHGSNCPSRGVAHDDIDSAEPLQGVTAGQVVLGNPSRIPTQNIYDSDLTLSTLPVPPYMLNCATGAGGYVTISSHCTMLSHRNTASTMYAKIGAIMFSVSHLLIYGSDV